MSAPVSQDKIDAAVVLLHKNGSATWRDIAAELGFSETTARRALTHAKRALTQTAAQAREIMENDRANAVEVLAPAHTRAAHTAVAMLEAKQAELWDAETGQLRARPVYSKDGEEIGEETPSTQEIKAFLDCWGKAWATLESVSGLDVLKKQAANKAKPASEGSQHIHFHSEVPAQDESRRSRLEDALSGS